MQTWKERNELKHRKHQVVTCHRRRVHHEVRGKPESWFMRWMRVLSFGLLRSQ